MIIINNRKNWGIDCMKKLVAVIAVLCGSFSLTGAEPSSMQYDYDVKIANHMDRLLHLNFIETDVTIYDSDMHRDFSTDVGPSGVLLKKIYVNKDNGLIAITGRSGIDRVCGAIIMMKEKGQASVNNAFISGEDIELNRHFESRYSIIRDEDVKNGTKGCLVIDIYDSKDKALHLT